MLLYTKGVASSALLGLVCELLFPVCNRISAETVRNIKKLGYQSDDTKTSKCVTAGRVALDRV